MIDWFDLYLYIPTGRQVDMYNMDIVFYKQYLIVWLTFIRCLKLFSAE